MSHVYRRALGFGLLFHFLAGICSAQVQTGTPPFGSFGGGPDIINLANLNVHHTVSVLHKPGRGTDFTYDLSYDTSVWYPVTSGSTQAWQAVPNFGWRGVTEVSMGYVSYAVGSGVCQGDSGPEHYHYRYNWAYHDFFGSTHSFPNLITLQGTDPWQCSGLSTFGSDTTDDGSGYSISATSSTATIYSSSGIAFTPPINTSSGAGTSTDRNGNQISVNTSGVFTDTLGTTVLTVAGSGTPSSPLTFTYTAPSGANAVYTMKYTAFTVQTAFGCSGISEYGPTSNNLVTEIDLPDISVNLNDKYIFTYEVTPGDTHSPHYVTGRLASITLPTGGAISYTYTGGSNGIECSDGSTAGLQRYTPDTGTAYWNYARTLGSGSATTTTITDPQGDQTVIQFQGIYQTQQQVSQLVNGNQTLLQTLSTCYNGNTTNCNSTSVTLPITQRNVTTILPNGQQSEHVDSFNTYGAPTEADDYDYGTSPHGPLLKRVLATYATLGNITAFRQTVTVLNGSGATVSNINYNYDETTPTTTSGTPQHVSVSGPRGNVTSVNTYTNSTTYLTKSWTYYDTGNLSTGTDVNGGVTTYNYASGAASCYNSFPTSITEAVNSLSTSMTWNCTGGVAPTSTDENSQTTTTSYTDPYFWRPASVTDPTGAVTTYCYGVLTSGTCTPSPNQIESVLSFNSGNSAVDTLTTTDSLGRTEVQQTRQAPSSANFDSVETDYDSLGRVSRVTLPYTSVAGQTNPNAPATTTTYDAMNRTVLVQDAGGGSTTYNYGQGNDVLVTRGPAPSWDKENTKRRQFEYDALGRLTSVCEVTAGAAPWLGGTCAQNTSQTGYWTKYGYDPIGNLISVTQNAQMSGSTQSRSFAYDWMSRMTSETVPEIGATGNGTASYTYDADSTCGTYAGDLVKKVDAAGNAICSTYDALHRQLTITYPSGTYSSVTPQKHFVYDGATVNQQTMLDAKARLAEAYTCFSPCSTKATDIGLSYTARGEQSDVYESTPNSGGFYYHTSQTYWASGSPYQLTGNIGLPSTMTYGADGEGRPSTVSASGSGQNPVSGTTYNAASLPTAINLGSGSGDADTYTYDPSTNRMSQYNFTVNGASLTGALGWNANATLQSQNITDGFNGADTQNCTYQYDDLTRLTSGNCNPVASQTFSYDPFGNINKSGSPYTFNAFYSTSTNRITCIGGSGPNCTGGTIPSYDNNGSVTNDSFHAYTWDADGHAITVDAGQSDAVSLTYDALGRMVEQNRRGVYTQIVYSPSGDKLALMRATTLQKGMVQLPGKGFAVYSSSGLQYYAHPDLLGSIRLASTPGRAMDFDTAYAPFGEPYASTGSLDPAYTGQMNDTAHRQDTAGGLYDFPLREYSTQGRWPNPDPLGKDSTCPNDPQTQNRYAYVRNNPMSFVDPLGAFTACDLGIEPCPPGTDGGGGGCDPILDPFCFPVPPILIGGIIITSGGNPEGKRPFPWLLLPLGFFHAFTGKGPGLCEGTTDCSYYQKQCKKATTTSSVGYYCFGAPLACRAGGLLPSRRWANCVRLQLQKNDTCLNIPDSNFAACEEKNHAAAFAFCTAACGLF